MKKVVYVVLSIVLLLILVSATIRLPFIQNIIVNKVEKWGNDKLQTRFEISNLYINFPTTIDIEQLYLEDLTQDTLLHFDNLKLDVNLFALLGQTVKINNVRMYHANAKLIKHKRDSVFNFQFIIDRFSGSSEPKEQSDSDWDVNIGGVELNDVRFLYDDAIAQSRLFTQIGLLDVNLNKLYLDSMYFDVDEIVLENTDVEFSTSPLAADTLPAEPDTSSATDLRVLLQAARINNTHVHLNDSFTDTKVSVGDFELEDAAFGLKSQTVKSKALQLANSEFQYKILKADSTSAEQIDSGKDEKPWSVNVASIDIENNAFSFHNTLVPQQKSGMDPNNISVRNIKGSLEAIEYQGSNIAAQCHALSFIEQSGVNLKQLQSNINFTEDRIDLDALNLHINNSKITGSVRFFPDHFINGSEDAPVSYLDIKEAIVHSEDITNALPSMKEQLPDSTTLRFSTAVSGQLSALSIDHFTGTLDSIKLKVNGMLNGLPDIKRTKFNIPDLQFNATSEALSRVLPDTVIPKNITLPDSINLRARLDGFWFKGNNRIELSTSYGGLNLELQHLLDTVTQHVQLEGRADINDFQLSRLLQNDKLGLMDGSFKFENRGQTTDSTNIKIDGNINTFEYNQYAYQNVEIDGLLRENSFDGNINMQSEALDFAYSGKAFFNDTTYQARFTLDLNHADLNALNFTEVQYNLKAHINTDIKLDTLGFINGSVNADNINVLKNDVFYKVDSIRLIALSNKSETDIQLNSDILSANLKGNIDLNDIPGKIKAHIDQYLKGDTMQDSIANDNKRLDFSLELQDKALLTNVLVPELNTLQITAFNGYYDGAKDEIYFNLTAPKISYGDNELDSLMLEISSGKGALRSSLRWTMLSNNVMSVRDFTMRAQTEGDAINLSINIPKDDTDLLHLGGELYQKDSVYYFSFLPGQVVFNGKTWQVPEDNYIGFSPGLPTNNMSLSRNGHELDFSTRMQEGDTSINLSFKNFNLSNIGNALSVQDTLIGGKLNGAFQMITSADGLAVNSDINIDQLTFHKRLVGKVTLRTNYKNLENKFNLDIESPDNRLSARGNFSTGEQLEYAITSKIDKLDVNLVQSVLRNEIDSVSGLVTGKFDVQSRTNNIPEVDGELNLKDIYVLPTYLNTAFKLKNERISFKNEKVLFKDLTIVDENNNNAVLNGNMTMDDFTTYKYQLSVKTTNFKLFNTTSQNHDLYYGTMYLDSDIDISGNQYQYDINANVSVRENSNFTFVVPETETSVASYEDVVRFIDKDAEKNPFLQQFKKKEQSTDTADVVIEGMDLQANVNVNEKSKLSIIIDKNTGDRLDLQGNADLSLSMPPAGDLRLSGRYEIVEGKYKLNFYQLARREFQIVKGSSVVWTGDPMEADLNVTTRYITETTPPVANNLSKMPFYVNLHIGGEILKPELSFELSMPEDLRDAHPNVYSVLQDYNAQESVLNQQVFGLVVLNKFFATESGSDAPLASSAARSSLSKILTQQLNRLASNINAVDLDVNLESYYTGVDSNAKTSLELGLSKSLFNNRLIVKVAGNVNMDQRSQEDEQDLSYYAGDIFIEYKISKNGELRLQGFKTDEYDRLEQGQVINTGAGLIFVKDYNNLDDLFNFKKEKRKREK